MRIHPDVLAAHAEFGGDLETMQKCFEWHDLQEQVAFTLSDASRLLRKQDVEGACPHPDDCFYYSDRVRCGPCAVKASAIKGIEIDDTHSHLPEVCRLRRELKAATARIAELEAKALPPQKKMMATYRAALQAAAEEFNRISCEGVTETRNVSDALDRAKAFADRGAVAVAAALRTSPTDLLVVVKPLVWHDLRGDGSLTATTTIGLQYCASETSWGFRNYPDLYPVEGGIEAATDEAQADYEARILPLIELTALSAEVKE